MGAALGEAKKTADGLLKLRRRFHLNCCDGRFA